MRYIHRHMENKVIEVSKSYPAILITGPRQSGKTTMLRTLSDRENANREYVTLDDLNLRDLAENDPALFLQLHKPPIIIDEIQYAPKLFTYIKLYVDKNKKAGDFWLTGSQIFSLMRGVKESLAGRVAVLHMSPLSQREIYGSEPRAFIPDIELLTSASKDIMAVSTPEVFNRIWRGSMPGLIGEGYTDRDIFYSSYVATYVERDVKDLSNAVDALKFNRFITACAARASQLLNYNALAEDADIDISTAKSWINILETLGIIFMLHPFSNNVLKRTIKTPKLYFYDTGLICYLTKWSSPNVAESGAMSGALFENYAVSEIMKSYHNIGREPYLYYYRDRDSKEIDIVIEKDGKVYPLEVKKAVIPDKRIIKTFGLLDKSPLVLGTGGVICMAERFGAFDRNNLIIPIWLL